MSPCLFYSFVQTSSRSDNCTSVRVFCFVVIALLLFLAIALPLVLLIVRPLVLEITSSLVVFLSLQSEWLLTGCFSSFSYGHSFCCKPKPVSHLLNY